MDRGPLQFEPVVLDKVWGGRRLEKLGKRLSKPGVGYGESWEIADLGATSASGAGGGAFHSMVANGPLKGKAIGEALAALGEPRPFPLLIKYLDARESLSVQVHPSPTYAAGNPGAHLKTESWYIVDVEPGAVIYKGLRPGVTREQFAAAVKSAGASAHTPGAPRAVVDLLESVAAIPGHCHTLPSGTVHALGAGVLVAEVQTPSDTTFRIYDWGRKGRELHVDQALACAFDKSGKPVAPPAAAFLKDGELCCRLAATEFYTIDEFRPLDGDEVTIGGCCDGKREARSEKRKAVVLMVISGRGQISSNAGGFAPTHVSAGSTVLIPSAISRQCVLKAATGLKALRITLPHTHP